MHKKVASVVTAAVLLVTMSTTAVIAKPLSDKLEKQESTLQQHRNDYKSAQRAVEEIEAKIEHFDMQIETLMSQIGANKAKIRSIEGDIEKAQKEIQEAQKELEEEQALYNDRMKAMYMNGSSGYLEVILGADSLGDLVAKVEAVRKLTELDKKIVKELNEKQESLQEKQDGLKKEQDNLQALNKSQEEKVQKLKSDKQEQDKLIAQARKQSSVYASVLENDESQIRQTKKLIEEARTRAKQARQASNKKPSRGSYSSNSSSNSSSSSSSSSAGSSSSGSTNASSDAIITYASQFLGTPYVWAANGPNSFDCSGFTRYVYAHFGVNLPRVSRDQAQVGTPVSRQNLQPGDLVFFKRGGAPVHHVGIYVGNGSYIHAPRTGDVVKISALSGRSDYAWARRVK